ncbi:MAG: efflux RND transporter periplasmic adaptor subunit [Chthoniobacterales bacterium]
MKTSVLTPIVIPILFLATGCAKKTATAPPPPPQVAVAQVVTRDVPVYLDEIGNCTANATVQVQAQVSGQISGRHFQDGANVKKGDLLFSIDARPYQAVLDQAQGQLAQARSQQALDEANLNRAQGLFTQGAIARQDFETAQATAKNDEAKTKSAEAAVTAAQISLDFCEIHSPIDGRAGQRLVDVGNVVSGGNAGTGGAVLLTIEALDPIYTNFAVAQSDLPKLRPFLEKNNLQVQTAAPGDPSAARVGRVDFVDNTIQPGAGTLKMRASTPNQDGIFWPVQFVRARLILDTLKDAKLVPQQAIQISQRGSYVFVLHPDNSVEMRLVRPGQSQDGGLVVIEDGLQADEAVVVTGQLALAPGTKVVPRPFQNLPAPQLADAKG